MKSLIESIKEKAPFRFDFKKYEKEMHHILSDKLDYHRMSFDWDEDIESIRLIDMNKDEVIIEINLPTGKGYGNTHYKENEYVYVMQHYTYSDTYKCTRMLADRDREAQLVRRFYAGFLDMTAGMNRPDKLTFIVKQELD